MATDQAVVWSDRNLISVTAEKTKEMVISFSKKRTELPLVTIDDAPIERTEKFGLLGVVVSSKLDWSAHGEFLHTKGSPCTDLPVNAA